MLFRSLFHLALADALGGRGCRHGGKHGHDAAGEDEIKRQTFHSGGSGASVLPKAPSVNNRLVRRTFPEDVIVNVDVDASLRMQRGSKRTLFWMEKVSNRKTSSPKRPATRLCSLGWKEENL